MLRTFTYKLNPSKDQIEKFEATLTTCRYLYNSALSAKIQAYKLDNRSISYNEQQNVLPILRKHDNYLKQVHSQVLQNVLRRIDKSFKNFFRRVKLSK